MQTACESVVSPMCTCTMKHQQACIHNVCMIGMYAVLGGGALHWMVGTHKMLRNDFRFNILGGNLYLKW